MIMCKEMEGGGVNHYVRRDRGLISMCEEVCVCVCGGGGVNYYMLIGNSRVD